MLGGMTVMTNPHHTAKGVVLGAKEIGGLTWAALAFVLGVPVATLTNWIRREDKEPYGPAVVLCMEIAAGPEAWSDVLAHRILMGKRHHPDGRSVRSAEPEAATV
jgi:hypothetical protein